MPLKLNCTARVAQVTKEVPGSMATKGLWSVIVKPNTKRIPAGSSTKIIVESCNFRFFETREDAWEESGWLLKKRPTDTAAQVKLRQSRSVGGEQLLVMNLAGRHGIGVIDGEYNSMGTNRDRSMPAAKTGKAAPAVTKRS